MDVFVAETKQNEELTLEEQLKLKKEKQKRFWLLTMPTILVYLFCFLLFPAFIIYTLLNTNYNLTTNKERAQILEKMGQKLNVIEKYCTTNKYFHQLLSKIADNVQEAQTPSEAQQLLTQNIYNLKEKYPDSLEFIVWDDKGEIIKELTDKKRFYAMMKKVYGILENVTNIIKYDPKANISRIKSVSDNSSLNILRSILGRITIPDHLKKPYLHGDNSGTLLTELGSKYSSTWFRIGSKISFLCFFAQDLIRSHTTLPKIIASLNNEKDGYICGYTTSDKYESPITPISKDAYPIVLLALAKYEASGESTYEDDNYIISINMPQPDLRSFCIYQKKNNIWSKQIQRDIIFYQIIILLIMLYLIIYLFINYKQKFISISWKLAVLFIIANVIPLSILGFITYNYLFSTSDALYEETANKLKHRIKEFDERQKSLNNEIELQLNEKFDNINEENKLQKITPNSKYANQILAISKQFQVAESALISKEGEEVFFYKRRGSDDFDTSFFKEFSQSLLAFCNGEKYKATNELYQNVVDPDNVDIIRKSYLISRKIERFALGNSDKLTYFYILGDTSNAKNNYLLYLSWDDTTFQTVYMNKYFNLIQQTKENISIYTRSMDGKNKWPNNDFPKELFDQMEGINEFSDIKTLIININKSPYLTVIAPGENLTTMLIAAIYPINILTEKIAETRNMILICAIISMILTLIIGQTLIKQFITPINNLQEGTIAVSRQQYNHRIPILDEDEFGHLNEVFNRVISGLEDFETAQIIQKSLLPGNHFNLGQMKVYAQNIIMTTLGGDYYDVIKINENHWGLVMGDVAGHGVGAGLMMAMAKAGILSSSEEEQMDPSVLTAKLHKMFFAIKNEKLKRMMTFQYLMVEPETNTFTFVNAGHCFPLIIHTKTKQAEFVEHIATPLGIGPRARYKNLKFTLEPGDSLILYTDGIAESKNEKGEEYTFERLRRNISELYNPDPEVFYKNIYGLYDDWSAQPEDDYTVMVINNG